MGAFGKAALALAAVWSVPAAAEEVPMTVSAADPEGIVAVLKFAGYPAELTTDDVGDPQIDTEFSGLLGVIMFYGCHEKTHLGCDSVQLRVGLDRREPMTVDWLHSEFGNDRFYGVHLDDEGDPWFNWDIVTGKGEGIPTSVFLLAVNQFSTQVAAASVEVFAEEREKDVNFSAPVLKEGHTT